MKHVDEWGQLRAPWSPPRTGAWIETVVQAAVAARLEVAPSHGGVD